LAARNSARYSGRVRVPAEVAKHLSKVLVGTGVSAQQVP
jgi:hypothetical protein